jgi:hypothetical protein
LSTVRPRATVENQDRSGKSMSFGGALFSRTLLLGIQISPARVRIPKPILQAFCLPLVRES